MIVLTHIVMKDFQSPDCRIQGFALSLIADMATLQMCQLAVMDVQKLINSSNSHLMKCAVMVIVRIVDHSPDSVRPEAVQAQIARNGAEDCHPY
jgi:vesicle coat complex subunit